MIGAALLAMLGLLMGAFFSGTETGLYRATRLRLVLDASGGSPTARGLLWLANHPALFVTTALVGNNLAHYVFSLALVLGTETVCGARGGPLEVLVPLLFAPVLFVYGELVPKSFFLDAPNRLLRRVGPLVLLFAGAFVPISGLVWAASRLLEWLFGQSPPQVQATMARRELRRLFAEGHEAEVLMPVQQAIAQSVFAAGAEPLGQLLTPLAQVPRARPDMARDDVLGLAQRYRLPAVCVEGPGDDRRLAGYYRVPELAVYAGAGLPPPLPLAVVDQRCGLLTALVQLYTEGHELLAVRDAQGAVLGIVTLEQLRHRILRLEK